MGSSIKSKRLNGIGEYYFSTKLKEIKVLNDSGRGILNLGIGNPDLPPPEAVEEALRSTLKSSDYHRYQSYVGTPELRQAISSWYKKYYEVSLNPDNEILPLIGSKEGIMHICMALLNPGDKVLVPDPGYPTYATAVKLAGGEPLSYDLGADSGYMPDFGQLQVHAKEAKLMWINYPHMPSGAMANREMYAELKQFCKENEIVLINDNPYSFILTPQPTSVLSDETLEEPVLELNSLSKSHNMPGWRVGMLVGNADLIKTVLAFKSNMDSGMFKPIMQAAIEAVAQGDQWYKNLNTTYSQRQRRVIELAQAIGCEIENNQAGMFVWARIPDNWDDAEQFSDHLIQAHNIFVPPGSIFGKNGDRYIRFSLCSDDKIWNEVSKRIKKKK